MNSARNLIVIVTGRKESGKSHLLAQYARRFPRRFVLDFTGEHKHDVPPALVAWSLADCTRIMRRAAARSSWTIVCELDAQDIPALIRMLLPKGRGVGFSEAVGGVVIETGELNEIAPNNGRIDVDVARIFSRGRHAWLSVLGAARRAVELDPITTSQADIICAFRQHHTADVKRIVDLMGERAAPALAQLQRYEYLRYFVDFGRLELVHADGRADPIPEAGG